MHTLRLIHRWIGLAVALPIALVAISGGLLVFRDAYYRARWPAVAAAGDTSATGQARTLERIERTFADERITSVKFPRRGVNAFHVYLAGKREALVHPASGEVIARWSAHSDPAALLFDLHAHLLAGATGEIVNGYLALTLVFLALSGLLLWWPRRRVFRLRSAVPGGVAPGTLLRSHAAGGALLSAAILVFAVTGVGLVFYEDIGRIMSAAFDRSAPAVPAAHVSPSHAPRASWTAILEAVRTALPESGPRMYYPGPAGNPVLTFRKTLPGEWHPNGRSYVLVDPYTAEVLQTIDARAEGTGTRMMHALYPIHAAKIGGAPMAAVAVVSAIGLAWLAISGGWVWVARRPRKRSASIRAPSRS